MSEYQKKLDEICICKKYDDLKQENYKLKLAIKLLQKKLKLYFVIQKEELTEVRWFSMQELQNMVKQKILNPNQIACFEKCVNYLKTK